MRLYEIGELIKRQRIALGLTQQQVARLAELSRTTVNQIENGTLNDLGFAKLTHLLGILGLDLQAHPAKGPSRALEIAARTASTSYQPALTAQALAVMFKTGELQDEYRPHLTTLLDETPLPLVIRAIHEVAQGSQATTTRTIMGHMAKWAVELRAHRTVW